MSRARSGVLAAAPSGLARRDLFYALLAGLVVPFAFAPYDIWPLAILALFIAADAIGFILFVWAMLIIYPLLLKCHLMRRCWVCILLLLQPVRSAHL